MSAHGPSTARTSGLSSATSSSYPEAPATPPLPPRPSVPQLTLTPSRTSASNSLAQDGCRPSIGSGSGPSNVFSRLQALFPASPSSSPHSSPTTLHPHSSPSTTSPSPLSRNDSGGGSRPRSSRKTSGAESNRSHSHQQQKPKFLKVRILTWNMHESLPKGDLEELLGSVPAYDGPSGSDSKGIPSLDADNSHPYHIVVVAGQECPSLSGLPMGLGAGLKLKDSSKSSSDSKDNSREKDLPTTPDATTTSHPSSGWTSILEDWYCNGAGSSSSGSSSSTSSPKAPPPPLLMGPSASAFNGPARPPVRPPTRSFSTGDILPGRPGTGKGVYEMVAKERMMGLYLAVYVHRDVRRLVRGTSKNSVTAGLIGGRVGNKGGVGVSLNIDGTTILFINAHLAAHGGRVHHRLANLAKIKAELSVDDFLKPDDPRIMAEDLTDKFDYTFLCGDLNFRLDITRLHADWLISRRDYEQALAFDQLRNIMQNGHAFDGFSEAPIDFPPTFKYDVLRTIKRSKTKSSTSSHRRGGSSEKSLPVVPTDEMGSPRMEEKETPFIEPVEEEEDDVEQEDDREDAASTASSYWMSINSRKEGSGDEDDEEDTDPNMSLSPPQTAGMANSTGNLANRLSIVAAAHKAKSKWMALVSPSATTFTPKVRRRRSTEDPYDDRAHSPSSGENGENGPVGGGPNGGSPLKTSISLRARRLSRSKSAKGARSTKSSRRSIDEEDEEDEDRDKGVYDSSAKQRVPSWCDRILWKSTVQPDLEPEEEETMSHSTRSRVSLFFAHAFRSRTTWNRRESISSLSSAETPSRSEENAIPSPPASDHEEGETLERLLPFSRFFQHSHAFSADFHPRKIRQAKSIESFPTSGRPSMSNSHFHGDGIDADRPRARKLSTPLVQAKTYHAPLTIDTSLNLLPAPHLSTTDAPPPVPPKDGLPVSALHGLQQFGSRWRFLPFLNRDERPTQDRPPTPTQDLPPPRPRKGDVVCLGYNTLDDRQMRRLEGRSDHRPVIGSYAVYI